MSLDGAGVWTLAEAPQPPATLAGAQGCYTISVTGIGLGTLRLSADDVPLTF